ncbi:MAG: type VI secretion system baseplate subunit TssE [Pseudomonadota bacterium]
MGALTVAAGSFFERLEPPPAERQRTRKQPDTAEQVAMIKRQLDILLNARQGASASTPDYGLTDFNDAAVSTADMTLKIMDDIKQTIRRYEPRVSIETVTCERDPDYPMELTFRIIGYLNADTAQEKMEIDLVMSGLDRYNKILR